MASGVYYLGLPLGAGASFVVAGVFGPQIGWRNCFYVLGAIGLVLTPVVFMLSDPERGQYDTSRESPLLTGVLDSVKQVWVVARRSPALAWAMVGAVFMYVPIGAAQFVEIWLTRERGFEPAQIMTLYGGLSIVFGTVGALGGGLASDWYLRRFSGGRLRFLALFLLVVTPLIVSYRFVAPDSPLFYLGMCAGFVSFTAFYGPVFSTVQDLSPSRLRGVSTAVLLLMCNLVGLGLGAVAAGMLSDWFSTMGFRTPLTYALISLDAIGVFTLFSFYIGSIYWQKQGCRQLALQ